MKGKTKGEMTKRQDEFRRTIKYREGGKCLWCGCKGDQVAHLKAYGMGRSRRSGVMDTVENACFLCTQHHAENHTGQITRAQLETAMTAAYGYIYGGEAQ